MRRVSLTAILLAGAVTLVGLVPGVAAETQAIRWDNWAGGTWHGYGTEVQATADLLTVRYKVGAAPDDWPNAQITFAPHVDISRAASLQFEIRVTTDAAKLPPRCVSLLLGTPAGANWQRDTLPTPVTPGQWIPESVDLIEVPVELAKDLGHLQFFVWNRDYHTAGLKPGDLVTIEVRNAALKGKRPERPTSVFQRPPLAMPLVRAGALTAWSEPPDTKLLPEQPAPAGAPGVLALEAAANEYASFQVALRAVEPLKGVRVDVHPPHRVGASRPAEGFATQTWLEGLVKTVRPSSLGVRPGLCPDPLLPETTTDLEAGQTRGMWVDLFVPPTARPGDYEGTISIRAAGQVPAAARYRLHVFGFTLPRTPALRTAFQLATDKDWSRFGEYYPKTDFALEKSLWEMMARHRIAPMHLRFGGPPRPADAAALREYDRYVDTAKEIGFNGFGPFMWGPPVATEEDRKWVRQMTDYYASKGVLDRLYVYMCQFDELQPDRYPQLREYAKALKAADPRLPRFVTAAPHPDLYGSVDYWCPGTPTYNREVADQRRALGEKVWWYTCVQWTPGLLLDARGTEHRALFWLTWTQKADGLLFWCINYWQKNPWEVTEQGPGTAGNGDGYLLYPRRDGDPADRIYETVRLKVIRDAIQNYDYLALLKQRLVAAETGRTAKAPALGAALRAAHEALAAAERVAPDIHSYSMSAEDYAYVRSLVARAIEGLPPTPTAH